MRTSPPARLDRKQIPVGARDAQHVAEGTEDHLGPGGDGQPLVDDLDRRDTDGAAGPVDQGQLGRQQPVDAEAQERVGLTAAHLHQRPRARHRAADRVNVAARGDGIPVLVEELHDSGRTVHLIEVGEDAVRGGAIHLADRETRMHHDKVAHGRFRDVGQADRLRGPAETHLPHGERGGVRARVDAHDLTGNPQAHAF